ncbi:hypothetical protein HaLaN_29962, partial [Haematococcus lacustris]
MLQTLEELGLAQRCWRLASQTASDELLRLAHSPEHIAEAVAQAAAQPVGDEHSQLLRLLWDQSQSGDSAAAYISGRLTRAW